MGATPNSVILSAAKNLLSPGNYPRTSPSAKLERMKVFTIPKALSKEGDLVVIPRREYEQLLALKKIREFRPTARQIAALKRAERNLKKGKAFPYDAVARALGLAD